MWHLVDFSYDGTSLHLYEDGSQFYSTGAGGSYNTASTSYLSLGPYPGAWADVAVYAGALSDGRIAGHYAAGAGTGPIGGAYTANQSAGGRNCACAGKERRIIAEPVDTATGNLFENVTDLSIGGRGAPLDVTRSYNSQFGSVNGPLGFGWTFNGGASLSQDSVTGNVTISQENGSQVTFTKSGSTYAPSAPRFIATLAQNADGSFTLTRQARETMVFSAPPAGQLLSDSDLNGYKTTYGYTSGQLTTITHAYDLTATPVTRALTLAYYPDGHLKSVTDPLNRVVTYQYNDGAGNLTDVTDVNGGQWHYTYDSAHHLTQARDPNLNTTTTVYDPTTGKATQQTQDQLTRVTKFSYTGDPMSATGGTTTVTDPKDNVTVDTYQNGLLTSETRGSGTPQAATWTYTYDPATLGRTTVTDPNGNVTATAYDQNGDVAQVTDAVGRTTMNTYDSLKDLLTTTDGNGHTTTMTYDGAGNLQTTSRPYLEGGQTRSTVLTYGDSTAHPGDVTKMTDPDGKVWTSTYDAFGDLSTLTDPPTSTSPNGDTTTYCYNAIGWRTATYSARAGTPTCGSSSPFETTFDYTDLRTGKLNGFGLVGTVTDPNGHTSKSTYDPDQNLVSSVDGDLNSTTYKYDNANESTDTVRPDSTDFQTAYFPDGTVSDQKVLDAKGNLVTHASYAYDPLARETSETVAPETPSLNHTMAYGYDPVGNLITVTYPGNTAPDVTNGYDAANEKMSVTYSDGRTPNVTSITYDGVGHRTGMTDATGLSSAWRYDSLDRLVETDTAPNGGAARTVQYGYDLRGQLTSIIYPTDPKLGSLTVTRQYDDAGRLTLVSDSLGHSSTFSPDKDSNVLSAQASNGTAASMVYDNADQLNSITTTGASFAYNRDGNSQVKSVTTTGLNDTNSYQYNSLNQLSQQNTSLYQYDPADDPTLLNGTRAQTYDPANEVQSAGQITLVGRGGAEAPTTSKAPLTISLQAPGGGPMQAAPNDQILVAITIPGNQKINVPSGFTQLDDAQSGTGPTDGQTLTFVKAAGGGETSVTLTQPGTLPFEKTAVAAVYRGADAVSPVDGHAHNAVTGSKTVSAGPVTASLPGDRLVMVEGAAGNAAAQSWANPSTPVAMTDEVHESDMALSATALADAALATAGSVGPEQATFGGNANLGAELIALKPALTQYGFDARGNRVSVTPPGASAITLGYDQANRLISSGSAATYTYRGDGLRMTKVAGGSTSTFTWDEAEGVPLLLDDGTAYYVYGPGNLPLMQVTPQPAISRVGTARGGTAATSASSTVSLQLPGGIQANDEIILGLSFPEGVQNDVKTPPAGYSQVGSEVKSPGTANPNVLVVYARKSDGSDSSQTVTATLKTPAAAGLVAAIYRGADPNNPIDITSTGSTNNGPSVSPGTVNTHYSRDEWVVLQGATYVGTSAESWSPPATMSEPIQANQNATITAGLADAGEGAPGSIGSLTSTFPVSGQLATMFVGLRTPVQVAWMAHDQLGSTRLLTDEAANVVGTFTDDPYGNLIQATGTVATPLLYAGEYRDAESGFYYLSARYYDPAGAQFLTRDPIVDLTRQPYAYAMNNPVNTSDPGGMGPIAMNPDAQHCDKGGNWGGVDPQDFQVFCGNGTDYWTHHEPTPHEISPGAAAAIIGAPVAAAVCLFGGCEGAAAAVGAARVGCAAATAVGTVGGLVAKEFFDPGQGRGDPATPGSTLKQLTPYGTPRPHPSGAYLEPVPQ